MCLLNRVSARLVPYAQEAAVYPSVRAPRQPEDAGRISGSESGNGLLCAEQRPRPFDPSSDAGKSKGSRKEIRLSA